ncbi:PQQ-dependent sugar dehydrogenase [Winogradskyella sp. DF17]|uniref:PQQ-dependent sugar dehydrogenase n=1 Tax=Winogradskyella pelagia TaxID=2819984 RepID=A0ABS3T4Y1_9FLAO|nr:PQQ-dependent sugar dehydrogenase [Winogradskyella sp. DF17]MBO3117803.1 PQQ-dependent sugar dehydrogenase [Winogradskyella sp. DF17]
MKIVISKKPIGSFYTFLKPKSKKIRVSIIVLASLVLFSAIPYFVGPGLLTAKAIDPYANTVFPADPNFGEPYRIAFPNLFFTTPITFNTVPNQNRIVVGQLNGEIFWFENNETTTAKNSLLDLSAEVGIVSDGGFLGLTIHPNFNAGTNPKNFFYVYYATKNAQGQDLPGFGQYTGQSCDWGLNEHQGNFLILERFEVDPTNLTFINGSRTILLKNRLYGTTHYGGGLGFGDDGFLYLTTGDMAAWQTSQDISSNLKGGVLRLDVDKDPSKSHPPTRKKPGDAGEFDEITGLEYWIPNDNPFLSPDGSNFEEYYSIGLRNPFRMTKDSATGTFYIGDVGLNTHEEVNVLQSGSNYGWPEFEGLIPGPRCYGGNLYDGMPHTEPLVAFAPNEFNSITGGYVYRGDDIPELKGKYLCSDYGDGEEIFSVDIETGEYEQIGTFQPQDIIAFGEDYDKELFLLRLNLNYNTYSFEPTNLYKLIQNQVDYSAVPQTLSETGVFSNMSSLEVNDGFIPYELYESFWSDGALKRRWIAIPNDGTHDSAGERIDYSEDGDWDFPPGTVIVKHFDLQIDDDDPSITRKIETRFSIVDQNGEMYFLTYNWNEDQTDAVLQTSALIEPVEIATINDDTRIQEWYFPSNSDCLTCHNSANKGGLGLRSRYLNTDYTYDETGLTGNQLVTLSHLGIIQENITDADTPNILSNKALGDPNATLDEKARSYFDLNCAYCHRSDNNNRANFDLRLFKSISETGLLTAGILSPLGIATDEEIVYQGDASKSILFHRMESVDPAIMMPPLAKSIVDQPAVDLIEDWINQLDVCLITDITLGVQSNCEPLTNTYTQELTVSYTRPPASGTLVVNGEAFEITGSPQTITLSNLDPDGTSVDLNAYFSNNTECIYTADSFFTAPVSCGLTGTPNNLPDDMINLGLTTDAALSGSVTQSNGRGNPIDILYDPVIDNYAVVTTFNEYGVPSGFNLGTISIDEAFFWKVKWDEPKYVNYITFGGVYSNQPQPNSMWRISYFKDAIWITLDEGQGGWIDAGIFEWGGPDQIPIIAEEIMVQVYSDGSNDVRKIHLRGRGGLSSYPVDDTATTPKATLIQYVPLDNSCGLNIANDAYLYCNESWKNGDEPTNTTETKDVYVGNGTYIIAEDEAIEVNNLEVSVGAKVIIEQGGSIKVHGNLVNNGVVELLSTSTKFSSLIVDGSSAGTINYKRHINAFNSNDLVSSPLVGNTFGNLAITNPNIFENPNDTNQKLFGPFNEVSGEYETYSMSTDLNEPIVMGKGYRTARDASEDVINGTTFTFTGLVETADVIMPITTSESSLDGWNLIGNPYASYISFDDFFTLNENELENSASRAVYGYNGSSSGSKWEILNALSTERLIAPGQGFFVKSKPGGASITFTPSMRRTGNVDDFVLGRNSQSAHFGYLRLEANAQTQTFNTEFFFNSNASSGLDPGYDASLFGGSAPPYSIYSHLVENDTGMPFAIQALGANDMNSITIPLGLNASQGQTITISIAQSDLPQSVNVYLEDMDYNTLTLLNNNDYSFTAADDLSGQGRFYLRFESSALNLSDNPFDKLAIIANNENQTIDIIGELMSKTDANLYDLHGRLVKIHSLNINNTISSIDVSSLSPGIYIVELIGYSQEKLIKKVIIQ